MRPFQLDLLFLCFFLFSQGRNRARRSWSKVGGGGGDGGAGGRGLGGGQAPELALAVGLRARSGAVSSVASLLLQMQQNGTVGFPSEGRGWKGAADRGRLHFLLSLVHVQLKLSDADEFFMHSVC